MFVKDVIVNMPQAQNKEKRLRAPCKFTVEDQEILFENGHKSKIKKCGQSIQSRLCGWLCLTFFPCISVLDGFFDTNSEG